MLIVHTIGFAAFASHPNIDSAGEAGSTPPDLRDDFTTSLGWLIDGILGDQR